MAQQSFKATVLLALALALSATDAFAPRYAVQRLNRVGATQRMAMAGADEVRLLELLQHPYC
jgi:hypothetical protein